MLKQLQRSLGILPSRTCCRGSSRKPFSNVCSLDAGERGLGKTVPAQNKLRGAPYGHGRHLHKVMRLASDSDEGERR